MGIACQQAKVHAVQFILTHQTTANKVGMHKPPTCKLASPLSLQRHCTPLLLATELTWHIYAVKSTILKPGLVTVYQCKGAMMIDFVSSDKHCRCSQAIVPQMPLTTHLYSWRQHAHGPRMYCQLHSHCLGLSCNADVSPLAGKRHDASLV